MLAVLATPAVESIRPAGYEQCYTCGNENVNVRMAACAQRMRPPVTTAAARTAAHV